MLSERRLRDWVALLGFDVDGVYGYLGALPVKGRAHPAEFQAGPSWVSGAYLIKARKRVTSLTLVRPRRRVRQRVLVGAAEPTTKVAKSGVSVDS
jgi:hypothetical protein